jgi:hypothetical protein
MRFNDIQLEENKDLLVKFIRKNLLKALELALLMENNEAFLLLILEEFRRRKSWISKISNLFHCSKEKWLYEKVLNVFTCDEKVHEKSLQKEEPVCFVDEIEEKEVLPKEIVKQTSFKPVPINRFPQLDAPFVTGKGSDSVNRLRENGPKPAELVKSGQPKASLNDTTLKYYLK